MNLDCILEALAEHGTVEQVTAAADVLLAAGPLVLAQVARRSDIPADFAVTALRQVALTAADDRDLDNAGHLVACTAGTHPEVQRILTAWSGRTLVALAKTTTDTETVATLAGKITRVPTPDRIYDVRNDNHIPISGPGTTPFHVLEELVGRGDVDDALAAADILSILLHHYDDADDGQVGRLLSELLLTWASRHPEETTDLLLEHPSLARRACFRRWAPQRLNDAVLVDIATALSQPGPVPEDHMATVYRLWQRDDAELRETLRPLLANLAPEQCAGRRQWVREVTAAPSTPEEERADYWRALTPAQAEVKAVSLRHKLSHAAARVVVARPDVSTDLAWNVARTYHHSREWVELRHFDREFLIRSYLAAPGWLKDLDDAELEWEVRAKLFEMQDYHLTHFITDGGVERFGTDRMFHLPWKTFHLFVEKSPAVAAAAAERFAPLVATGSGTQALALLVTAADHDPEITAHDIAVAAAATAA